MQAGAHMVKLEGGGWTSDTVRFLVERGIPVCAHLGLTPQTVHSLGGYRVQGKTVAAAAIMRQHALELQDAGAALMVLEMVPAALAAELTAELPYCPTIGIGAGNGTAGQAVSYTHLDVYKRQWCARHRDVRAVRRCQAPVPIACSRS